MVALVNFSEKHNAKIVKELVRIARKAIKTNKPQTGELYLFGKLVQIELLKP